MNFDPVQVSKGNSVCLLPPVPNMIFLQHVVNVTKVLLSVEPFTYATHNQSRALYYIMHFIIKGRPRFLSKLYCTVRLGEVVQQFIVLYNLEK